MTSNTPWMPITKPVKAWNKQLNTDFKDFFLSLSKAAIDGVVGKWDDAASNAVDALEAVGLTHDAGQIAWLLIRRALARATFDLIQEHVSQLQKAPKNPNEFVKALDDSLENVEMTIDAAFFEHPRDLPVVAAFQIPFKQWLIAHGFEEAPASTLVARLPTYFVYALNHEWRRKPEAYKLVKEALETPFTRAGEREQNWNYYYAWLQKQIHASVFNETFSLHQIYIPLRAYYEREVKSDSDYSEKRNVRVVVDLTQELDKWVNQANPHDAIRFISGGPGAGKSSFTRIYAAHHTDNPHLRVLFIPLDDFDPKGDLISRIGEFASYTKLRHNPLDRGSSGERLLIIFDGLDEMQGKMGEATVRDFVDDVDRTVSRLNYNDLLLQVLLTGRDVVIQTNASKFRKEAQHLHIMPYFLSEKEQKYFELSRLLQHDQRQEWWQQYGTATGKEYQQMPEALQRKDLDEITSQPLLNYLVALSYARGKVNFSLPINLNRIYEDLLKAVYKRDWAERRHSAISNLSFEQFARILEEISLTTWRNDDRTATFSEVQKRCEAAKLSKLLDNFRQGAELGTVRLFTTFYFRQHEVHRDSEPTFEFTHESFSEYLIGRHIVGRLEHINDQRQKSGWNTRTALKHWVKLFRDTPPMTQELFHFISREIALKNKEMVDKWQEMLSHLINWMLQYGMPMELFDPRPSYHKETLSVLRAEEALLAVLYACACVTEKISRIERFQKNSTSVGMWLSKLQGQRNGNVLALECLGYLDLHDSILDIRDLYGANLRNADLHGVELRRATIDGANLTKANLEKANLERSRLAEARLVWAKLVGANLVWANLERASLRGANLERASLTNANLVWAHLLEANLVGANLDRANLTNATLMWANLEQASIRYANLTEADLTGANLDGADLTGAILEGAILPDDTKWTPDTDIERFIEPIHPNYWRKSQLLSGINA